MCSWSSDERQCCLCRNVIPRNGSTGLFATGLQFSARKPSATGPSSAELWPPALPPGPTSLVSTLSQHRILGFLFSSRVACRGSRKLHFPVGLYFPQPWAAHVTWAPCLPASVEHTSPLLVACILRKKCSLCAAALAPALAEVGMAPGPLAVPAFEPSTPAPISERAFPPAVASNMSKVPTADLYLLKQVGNFSTLPLLATPNYYKQVDLII
jgi:hypothetical protein